jgi:VRR-NUC domain-containing protein
MSRLLMSLRIPLTVKRCPGAPQRRVRFHLGGRCRPGEAVVLRRWRDRSNEPAAQQARVTFDGCRLPPGTWSLLNACASAGLDMKAPVQSDVLRKALVAARQAHPTWRCPQHDKFARVIEYLRRRGVLQKILARDRKTHSPGLPDLFLWRTRNGAIEGGQFVEVKRRNSTTGYKERVSETQHEELDFLKDLGLKARVIYLKE